MTTEDTTQLPKDSYRALLHRRANGLAVDDFECQLWRREEELIRCALDYATHFKGTPLKPQHFAAVLHAVAWEAILQMLEKNPEEDHIDTTVLLSHMRTLDDERCAGHHGRQWLVAVLTEPPVNPEFAIDELSVNVLQHHRLRLWNSRLRALGARVGAESDLPSLQNDFVSAAMDIAYQVHGEGRVDQPFSDFEWDPANKTITSLVRTGIDAIDRCAGGGHGRGEMLVWGGGTGHGKCLAKGEEVLLHNGRVKKVEEVATGDLLMGPDGEPRRVLGTNSGEAEMFDVKPRSGRTWRVNEDHILTLVGTGFNKGDRKRVKSGGRELGGTRWAQDVVDVSVREWRRWNKKRKHNFKLMRAECLEFGASGQELSLNPYFLGVLLGDGCIAQSNVWVITADEEIVGALQEEADRFGLRLRILPSTAGKTAPTYSLSRKIPTGRNPILEALEKLGLYRGTTSGTKFIPFAYKVASRDDRLAILAGLMDTDGHAVGGAAYDYVSKSERLAEDVAFVARSLGLFASVAKCQKTCTNNGVVGDYFRVYMSGALNEIPARIERKMVPADRKLRTDVLKIGFDIVPSGTVEPYFGFTLDGDGRFLLGDFTVTHNSYGAQSVLRHQAHLQQRALYISCEDAAELMFCRTIADLSEPKLSPKDVRTKRADPEIVDRALTRLKAEYANRIHVVEMKKPTIGRVLETILRYRYVKDIDIVLIDYLQAITEDEPTTNKVQEMSSVTSKLKRCFTDCRVAGIVFSQYSRESYKAGTEPGINSMKYCGDIENEAEVLVVTWKDPEGTLHAKLPKVKWSSSQDLRYVIPIDPVTGCQGEWELDAGNDSYDD